MVHRHALQRRGYGLGGDGGAETWLLTRRAGKEFSVILLLESKQEMLTWALAVDGMRMIRVNDGSAPSARTLRSVAVLTDLHQMGGGLVLGRGHQEPAPPVALQGATPTRRRSRRGSLALLLCASVASDVHTPSHPAVQDPYKGGLLTFVRRDEAPEEWTYFGDGRLECMDVSKRSFNWDGESLLSFGDAGDHSLYAPRDALLCALRMSLLRMCALCVDLCS